jgi:hypothetical protein
LQLEWVEDPAEDEAQAWLIARDSRNLLEMSS